MQSKIISIQASINNTCRKIWDKELFFLLFFLFFIIHGEMLFNKISWWDDISGVLGGAPEFNMPLPHGRWFCLVLEPIFKNGSLPVFNGVIVAACIAVSSLILFDMFDIQNKIHKILLGLILISIPAVTANLGYMGASGSNFIGILICILGAYLTCLAIHNSKKITIQYWIGAFLFACSLGEYQCYFSLYLSLCLIFFIYSIITTPISFKYFYKYFGYYIINIFVGLALYLVILQATLWFTGVKLLSYAHTDTYGIVPILEYLERLKLSYLLFFDPYICSSANMFPFQWNGWYKILLIVNVLLCALVVITFFRTRKKETRFQFYMLILLLPCALNSNVLLYGWKPLHSLHVYHQFVMFFLPILLLKSIEGIPNFSLQNISTSFVKTLHVVTVFIMFIFVILYVRYDNYCYMLSELRLSQAISYFNTLSTRIMTLKDYREEYPVVFINEVEKRSHADTITIRQNSDFPVTNPYGYPFVNSYAESSRAFIKHWCGFTPEFADAKKFENNSIVQSMPRYPDDGSIKIIDNTIVVKF